jgi:hypothetical protein
MLVAAAVVVSLVAVGGLLAMSAGDEEPAAEPGAAPRADAIRP